MGNYMGVIMKTSILFVILITLSACSAIYKPTIYQGNIITGKMSNAIHTGMRMDQIEVIMGTPLIADPFHKNRWDYVYITDSTQRRRVTVHFEGGKAVKIDRWFAPNQVDNL